MGQALADRFSVCRTTFAEADRRSAAPPSRLCFEGPDEPLMLTENTRPAPVAVSAAACRLLMERGVTCALIAQVSSPVRREAVVRRLASEGVTTYVEMDPGTVLSGQVGKIHREATVMSFGGPDDLAAVESLHNV